MEPSTTRRQNLDSMSSQIGRLSSHLLALPFQVLLVKGTYSSQSSVAIAQAFGCCPVLHPVAGLDTSNRAPIADLNRLGIAPVPDVKKLVPHEVPIPRAG